MWKLISGAAATKAVSLSHQSITHPPTMPTSKVNATGSALVLTTRDRTLITDLADYGVLTREQVQSLGHFASKTRANTRLLRLTRAGYLSRRALPTVMGSHRALYFMGPRSLDLLDRPRARAHGDRRRVQGLSDLFLEHQLFINDVRLLFQRPMPSYVFGRWLSEPSLRELALGLVPDGYVEYLYAARHFSAFLELDRGTERLARWADKVRCYQQLATSGQFVQRFSRRFFRVLVVTSSPTRLTHLREVVAKFTDRIFWFATLEDVRQGGTLARVWLRPVDPERHALTES